MNWPGSRWWKLDLHCHSPASYDFGTDADRATPDWTRWLEEARDSKIEVIAVTDHNTSGAIQPLQAAAAVVPNAPVIFPGVELTASDGTHLLAIFDPKCKQAHVDDLLTRAEVPITQRGRDTARSPLSVEQLLRLDCAAIFIAAHANGPRGLLAHDGQQRINELGDAKLAAVELAPVPAGRTETDAPKWLDPASPDVTTWLDGSRAEVRRVIPKIACSDAHAFGELGRRFTWVKMSAPTASGLRLALMDGDMSLRPVMVADGDDPNRHASHVIESIAVSAAKYIGRPQSLSIVMNPWFNAMIGGRGTGKSTIVDLCRRTLGRDDELGLSGKSVLRDAFDLRMRVPASRVDEGLLTRDTRVEIVYRKDRERFVLTWDRRAEATTIARLSGEERIAEDGSIPERFPVRIYSQKQLFDLAKKPSALLTFIDDTNDVRATELLRISRDAEAKYLWLLAESRARRAQVSDLPARSATLRDVRRKIDLLTQGDHAATLGEYRTRRECNGAWTDALASFEDQLVAIENATAVLSGQDEVATQEGDEPTAALRRAGAELKRTTDRLRATIVAAVATARAQRDAMLAGADAAAWRAAVVAAEAAYKAIGVRLAAEGIANTDDYGTLLERAATLEKEIGELEALRGEADRLDANAAVELTRYRTARADLTARRQAFAARTSGALVRVEVRAYSSHDELGRSIRDALGIERFDSDHDALRRRIGPEDEQPWSFQRLDQTVTAIREFIRSPLGSWPCTDRRFETALRALQPERVDRLALYLPDDAIDVSFHDPRDAAGTWRQLAQGSPGQQTAALLAFILGHGEEPIILDQPEDDLDTTLIYELLVRRLREMKQTRQIIVVTHNPNIVVHGDAELVVSLEAHNGQTRIAFHGGLQEERARDEVCRVMEGGRAAFAARYRRIMHEAT